MVGKPWGSCIALRANSIDTSNSNIIIKNRDIFVCISDLLPPTNHLCCPYLKHAMLLFSLDADIAMQSIKDQDIINQRRRHHCLFFSTLLSSTNICVSFHGMQRELLAL